MMHVVWGPLTARSQDGCHLRLAWCPKKRTGRAPSDTAPFYGYALRPGITFTYFGLTTDEKASVFFDGQASPNIFAAGEISAGNVLGKGYTAGVGMSIGTAFGASPARKPRQLPADQGARHAPRSLPETAALSEK